MKSPKILIQMRLKGQTRYTELWGVSIALLIFGVLMPKGERVLLGMGICMGVAWVVFLRRVVC